MTSISGALNFAEPLFTGNTDSVTAEPIDSLHQIIDISGDGTNNSDPAGVTLPSARQSVLDAGITINGLPIEENTGFSLTSYYSANVIGGPYSFIETAPTYANFTRFLERKLAKEFAANPEPSTWFLSGCGLLLLGCLRRRPNA